MDRKILFRGKQVKDKEWIYGFYVNCCNHHCILPVALNSKIGFDGRYGTWLEISSKTMCQYTGLTDKGGRKIFEGDIIQYKDEVTGKVKADEIKYNETNAAFCRLHRGEMGLQYLYIDECMANKCEVIGNIYDNPELVEGDKTQGRRMFIGRV